MPNEKKNLLIIELNEFSIIFLKKFIKNNSFKNINKFLDFNKSNYFTKDKIQGENLDPWVQWVSVHTGIESNVHNIYRLGDIPSNKYTQFWETNEFNQNRIGLWGLMNASRNNSNSCRFFVPDPWTFSEKCYPNELNSFLNIARYSSTNYLNISFFKILKLSLNFFYLILKKGIILKFFYELFFNIIPHGIKNGFNNYLFISFYEYLGALLFIKLSKLNKCDISIIFLNLIAHIQHHYWDNSKKSNDKCYLVIKYLDKILYKLYKNYDDIIIHNGGISQLNTIYEKPWICYRPNDQKKFLQSININLTKVMPLMTHDAHIFFDNNEDLEKAYEILKNTKINNVYLFKVIKYLNERKLFYTIDFFDEITPLTEFVIYEKKYNFLKYFKRIVKRTGRHINEGEIFSNLEIFDKQKFENHKFNTYLLKYFS